MLFVFVFLLFASVSAKTCGVAEKCGNSYRDVPDLVRCLISDAVPYNGIQKILNEMATKLCERETVDQIAKEFKQIIMSGADVGTLSKALSVNGPLEKCLKGHKTTLEDQIQVVAKVIGQSATVQKMSKIGSAFKGRCKDQKMMDEVSKMFCPLLTFENIKMGMQMFKKYAGPPFECMKHVEKMAHVKEYGVL